MGSFDLHTTNPQSTMPTADHQPIPSHYGSLSTLIRKFVFEYLKGIDAMIRWIGTSIVISIFYGIVWAAVLVLIRLPFGDAVGDMCEPYVLLLASPLVIRFGILAGGFEIPAIFTGRLKKVDDTQPR